MVSHSGLITVMQRAVRKAAPRLRRDFGEVEQLQVSRKGPADFVSMADKRAEATILDELRYARPNWGLVLEEGGEIAGEEGKPKWIVDPLDGTTNFLHGVPHFAISIAVEELRPDGRGEITHGRDPRRAGRGQIAQARPAGQPPDELPRGRPDDAQENGRTQLRLQGAMVIGVILAVVIGIILLGVFFKLLKLAIIVALIIGGVMYFQGKLGNNNNDRPRIK